MTKSWEEDVFPPPKAGDAFDVDPTLPDGTVLDFSGDAVPSGWSLLAAWLKDGVVVRVRCQKGCPDVR